MEEALSPEEIRIYKQRLLEEFAAHAVTVETVEQGALEPSGGSRFQDVDESVEEAAMEADLEVLDTEDELGYEVHDALERIASSSFGRCESCGQTISRQRLDLVPYARLCAGCARTGGN
jgi:RNA polymerase-binding transcription factor DksA